MTFLRGPGGDGIWFIGKEIGHSFGTFTPPSRLGSRSLLGHPSDSYASEASAKIEEGEMKRSGERRRVESCLTEWKSAGRI